MLTSSPYLSTVVHGKWRRFPTRHRQSRDSVQGSQRPPADCLRRYPVPNMVAGAVYKAMARTLTPDGHEE